MTQSSSLDAPFSQSSLLFAARSSPFVCLADALEIIISLVIHVVRGKPLRQAALLVNWQRARHRLGEDVEELEDIPAEKHPWGYVILLVAAVLQAAKIFGFQGMLWTKVWAGLYLSSYVIIALVGFLAPRDWRDSRPNIVSSRHHYLSFAALSKVLLWPALGVHFVCCSWILDRIIVGDLSPLQIPFFYEFVPMLVTMAVSAWLAALLAGLISSAPFFLLGWLVTLVNIDVDWWGEFTWSCSHPVRIVLMSLIFLGGIGWLCSFGYLTQTLVGIFLTISILEESVFFTFVRGSTNLLLYIGMSWLIGAFLVPLGQWVPLLKKFNKRAKSHGHLVVFACWNFVQALLYYRLRYDSKGTIKPPWTDNLG